MEKRRVCIVGMGSVSPYGIGNTLLHLGIKFNMVRPIDNLSIKVAKDREIAFPISSVSDVAIKLGNDVISRELLRTMSPMSVYAYLATQEAWVESHTNTTIPLNPKEVGIIIGSTLPSVYAYEDLFQNHLNNPKAMPSTLAFKTMTHTVSLNIAQAFKLGGRVINPGGACAGGLASVALAFEAIRYGKEIAMICGGAEEYHPYLTLIFNKLGIATKTTSKPFDVNRDGIVIGEGAGILILEEYDHALERGAKIIAEVLGVGMNNSSNISFSDRDSILDCMYQAISDAPLFNDSIDFINAHATGTTAGDIEEGKAIEKAFLHRPYVNSLKGYLGHTMGASGALELISSLLALKDNTWNQLTVLNYDKNCGNLNINQPTEIPTNPILLKNSFGLGGQNTSVIVKINNIEG